jgi:hypothetical protein
LAPSAVRDESSSSRALRTSTRLLKIGAQIRVTVRKVWVSMSSSYPWQGLYRQVWANCTLNRMELGAGTKDRYKKITFWKDAIDELLGANSPERPRCFPPLVILASDPQ